MPDIEEGPVHRPLIRAQLPRIEGHKEERRLPEFTIRQAGRGGGGFRGGDARDEASARVAARHRATAANGNRPHGGRASPVRVPAVPDRSQPGRGGPSARLPRRRRAAAAGRSQEALTLTSRHFDAIIRRRRENRHSTTSRRLRRRRLRLHRHALS